MLPASAPPTTCARRTTRAPGCPVATHCTEADVSPQHFAAARELGMETAGFLMMCHRTTPEELARQARIMADAGCQCPYVTDSAGALLMTRRGPGSRRWSPRSGDEARVGYHGHQNMSLGIANSVIAYESGVRRIDGSLCALGAGSGNSPTEVLGAVFDRMGISTGVDVLGLLTAAEEVVRPYLQRWPKMDRNAIVQGWAGVYSASCCTPSARPTATRCPPTRSSPAAASAGWSAARKT